MAADLTKFNVLLFSNNYSAIEYFSYHNCCIFTKVLHLETGRIFLIQINRRYKMTISPENLDPGIKHYPLSKDNTLSKDFTVKELSEQYPLISLDNDPKDPVDNIATKLKINYQQPLTLHKNTAWDYLQQMKRIKHCFKLLEYKIVLQTQEYLITLLEDNSLQVFKIDGYSNPTSAASKTISFFIIVQLEQFYAKMDSIHKVVQTIENDFFEVLNLNQEKHTQYMTSKSIRYFIENNADFLEAKQKLHDSYAELGKTLKKVIKREQDLDHQLFELQMTQTPNIHKDAEKVKQRDELERGLQLARQLKDDLFDKLIFFDIRIKSAYLILDQLGFDLTLAFNQVRNELQFLQKNLLSVSSD